MSPGAKWTAARARAEATIRGAAGAATAAAWNAWLKLRGASIYSSTDLTYHRTTPHQRERDTSETNEAPADVGPIDVVYTWVDASDPAWQAEHARYAREAGATGDVRARRFKDRGELRYSLRALEAHMPNVRRVFLVTNGQVPAWLRREHPRLTVVPHRAIFDDPTHLPTFNSTAIELHLHKIPGLSEHFAYVNDDLLVLEPLPWSRLLDAQGRARITLEARYSPVQARRVPGVFALRHHAERIFAQRVGPLPHALRAPIHGPMMYSQTIHRELAALFADEVRHTSAQRFRNATCLALVQVVYPQFAFYKGYAREGDLRWISMELTPRARENRSAFRFVDYVRPEILAVNDALDDADDRAAVRCLRTFAERRFPQKSTFEA